MRKLFLLFAAFAFTISAFADASIVYLKNSADWTTVNCYSWHSTNGGAPEWPGESMTPLGDFYGKDLYYFSAENKDLCIFNNIPKNGSGSQTSNLTWTAGQFYDNSDLEKSDWTTFASNYIAHNWNNGSVAFKEMVEDNESGLCTFVGRLGSGDIKIITKTTGALQTIANGSITKNGFVAGDWCTFTWNPSAGTIVLSAPTFYYRGSDNGWGATAMTQVGETKTYYYTISSLAATTESKFQLSANSNAYEINSGHIDNTGSYPSNIVLNGSGSDISIYLNFASDVTIYFDAVNEKVYAQVPYYDVTVFTNVNRHLYAYDNGGNSERAAHHGPWGGRQSSSSSTANGSTWYEYHVLFPQGQTMKLKFTNASNYESDEISIGSISASKTLCYYLAGGESSKVIAYSYGLRGNFVDDFATEYPFVKGETTISNLTAGWYQFKVVEAISNKWYTCSDNSTYKLDPTQTSVTMSTEGGNDNNTSMFATIHNNYTFVLDASTLTEPEVSLTYPTTLSRSVPEGHFGTICVPVDATITGADLYTVTNVGDGVVTFTPTGSTALTAGKPYVIKGTSNNNSQTISLGHTSFRGEPLTEGNNGLVGVYPYTSIASGKYILYTDPETDEDQIRKTGTGCYVDANRAYFDFGSGSLAPSAFRIVEGENNATSVEDLNAAENTVKFFENGELRIRRNGITYDAIGRQVR